MKNALSIRDLNIYGGNGDGAQPLVQGINLAVDSGSSLTLIGETGCGKSLIAQTILGLVPRDMHATGAISFKETDLLPGDLHAVRQHWGREVFLFPQEPARYLHPLRRSLPQVCEIYRYLLHFPAKRARRNGLKQFAKTGLTSPDCRKYPWQLSGGMSQRLLTAITLAQPAALIVADEPTKGLDRDMKLLTVALLKNMVATGKTLFAVTHDLEVAAQLEGNMAVMYGGMIMEHGRTAEILTHPRHPYTMALLEAMPENGLKPIPRQVSGNAYRGGCVFAPRCIRAGCRCFNTPPPRHRQGKQQLWCHQPLPQLKQEM